MIAISYHEHPAAASSDDSRLGRVTSPTHSSKNVGQAYLSDVAKLASTIQPTRSIITVLALSLSDGMSLQLS